MSAPPPNNGRTRLATDVARAAACALAIAANGALPGASPADAAARPAPAPTASLVGPGRDLEAGRLIAELAQATDDPVNFERARASGFAARALDRLDADAAIAGDARLFAATRAAFAAETRPILAGAAPPTIATPAASSHPVASPPAPASVAYTSLIQASQRYLKRVDARSSRITVMAELVAQIAFNANYDRDERADAIERATLATIDDADYLDPGIGVERRALIDLPDDAWRAIANAAAELETGFDAIVGARGTPTPPPFAAVRPPAVPAAPDLQPAPGVERGPAN